MSGDPKHILTTGDVAALCRCSHDTVKRWLESAQLRGHRLTAQGQWRVLPKDLLDFMERHGLPIEDDARAIFGLPEAPIKDYVYCWEFHKRNKSHPAVEGKECENCLVFRAKAKECFSLRDEAGHQQVFCRGPCTECEYYRHVMEIDVSRGGVKA
jgi:hypothetical protein